ncbi:uncharacterized protein LOC124135644 [Haliotis rufescens]|uniref:uncharacterized protein LOC124135644 n=1 Tax=Haliotis rufescens TaxID=6454 RepID=UPI00201F1D0D|nr:uncharacterized protein LOC124135644 [Haliotis rufescens]XP_046357032.2 uncharacterized protein LOC124135644 [Haliotis rufescens]XP_046357033.2 uncharacterized protein LOC124135644 [Haliotis rufescens]XP_048255657.1 uncharacterized protein LOC124135644 [Haliotis rufescens]
MGSKKKLLVIVVATTVIFITWTRFAKHPPSTKNAKILSPYEISLSTLSHLLKGHWKTRPLTKKEDDDIMKFLSNANARFRLPKNYQRIDGLCGNVTHTGSEAAGFIKALCDPKGTTPCCFNNKCAMKSVEECVCPDCYDMRNQKHAEYSTWTPSDPRHGYKEHSPHEACSILSGSTILFVGDSLVRHVYTAMVLLVTGNMKDGAMNDNVPQDIRNLCSGMDMFTEKVCRLHLKYTLQACNGTVKLEMQYLFSADHGQQLKQRVINLNSKSLLLVGIGIHNNYDHTLVQTKFLLPTLNYKRSNKRYWPKVLWATSHAPGMMKSPKLLAQSYESVKRYNGNIDPFLKSWEIPVFDTFNMTDGMTSFDGEHYGLGMNVAKANVLLSYLNELKNKGLW